jgi:colanic acid/amylovoran biosynthesis protein
MITIGLLWHSLSSGNLGVGALTESHIAIISSVAQRSGRKVRFVVLGPNKASLPELVEELSHEGHLLEAQVVRVFRKEFQSLARQCDLILDIGAGDSFATIYGFKRFFYYWLSKNIVRQVGTPLILSPQTIGPFDSWLSRNLARQVMRRCERVFARDNLSRAYLSELKLDAVSAEAIDVAFALPFDRVDHGATDKVRVGVNVSGLLFNGGYTGNNQFGLTLDYAETIRKVLAAFHAMPNVELHLVSHVIEPHMPVEDDVAASAILAKEFPGAIMSPVFTRPGEAKSYIAGLDFFTGARMHACIAAFSSGVPVVPMAYSRKFNGLFGTLGYDRIADCKADSAETAVQKILDGFHQREQVRSAVAAALETVRARLGLYEACLSEVMLRVGQK